MERARLPPVRPCALACATGRSAGRHLQPGRPTACGASLSPAVSAVLQHACHWQVLGHKCGAGATPSSPPVRSRMGPAWPLNRPRMGPAWALHGHCTAPESALDCQWSRGRSPAGVLARYSPARPASAVGGGGPRAARVLPASAALEVENRVLPHGLRPLDSQPANLKRAMCSRSLQGSSRWSSPFGLPVLWCQWLTQATLKQRSPLAA